jgi:hypothetical protein
MPDVHFHVNQIPAWVWFFLIVLLMFFGVLYFVPEARQAFGHVFVADPTFNSPGQHSNPIPAPDGRPSAPSETNRGPFETPKQATARCGPNNYELVKPLFPGGADTWACKED